MREASKGPFTQLHEQFKFGKIGREEFFRRSIELGVVAPVALFVANNTTIRTVENQGIHEQSITTNVNENIKEDSLPKISNESGNITA